MEPARSRRLARPGDLEGRDDDPVRHDAVAPHEGDDVAPAAHPEGGLEAELSVRPGGPADLAVGILALLGERHLLARPRCDPVVQRADGAVAGDVSVHVGGTKAVGLPEALDRRRSRVEGQGPRARGGLEDPEVGRVVLRLAHEAEVLLDARAVASHRVLLPVGPVEREARPVAGARHLEHLVRDAAPDRE